MAEPLREVRTVAPYLHASDGAKLVTFIKEVFDAKEIFRSGHHVELKIGDSIVMMGGADGYKGDLHPAAMFIHVDDAEKRYRRALERGATSMAEPYDDSYARDGGMTRTATVKDPFGNVWYITTLK